MKVQGTCGRVHHAACAPNPQSSLGKGGKYATHGNQAIFLLCHGLHFDSQMLHPAQHTQQIRDKTIGQIRMNAMVCKHAYALHDVKQPQKLALINVPQSPQAPQHNLRLKSLLVPNENLVI